MLESHLETLNFKPLLAMSGVGALKKAEQHCPDLILLDTGLSDMDGAEVAAGIRDNWKTHRIPILAISGFSFSRTKCLESGCNIFLSKPFTVDELLSGIKKLLNYRAP